MRFVVGLRGDDTFAALAGLLRRGNSYAKAAGALILLCADEGEDERTALYSGVDAGAAMANLTIEAVSRGLIAHPMAGFDVDGGPGGVRPPGGLRPLMSSRSARWATTPRRSARSSNATTRPANVCRWTRSPLAARCRASATQACLNIARNTRILST